MIKNFIHNNKKIYIDFNIGLILTILISFITFLLVLFFSGSLILSGNGFFIKLINNYVPIFFAFIILYYLTNNFVLTNGFLLVLFTTLAILNKIKIFFRQIPLYYFDFTLIDEVYGIARSLGGFYIFIRLFAITLGVIVVFGIAGFIKTKPYSIKKRIIYSSVFIMFFLFFNTTILSNSRLYNSLEVSGNKYDIVEHYNTKGFVYSFIYKFNNRKISVPTNYDYDYIHNNVTDYDKNFTSPQNLPVIIMIQSEAFSEIGLSEKFDFDNYNNPYKNYIDIKESSYSGNLVVPNYGGGTSDTEFDILTGMNTRFLRHQPFAYRLINDNVETIPNILKKLDYYSIAMHPGESWFYNRENVFQHFGFDEFIDISSFDKTDTKGLYISETQTFESIINSYKDFVSKDSTSPYFSFNITIQNHGPFVNKYGASKNFDTSLDFKETEINSLANFFVGVEDIDKELKGLVDFFEAENRPVILVYWSDHQPSFPISIFEKVYTMESEKDLLKKYTNIYNVPFLIWENSSSKNKINVVKKLKEKNISNTISSFYLSALIFDVLDLGGLSYYIDYNSTIMEKYPVLLEDFYYNDNDLYTSYEDNMDIDYYKKLLYYRLVK